MLLLIFIWLLLCEITGLIGLYFVLRVKNILEEEEERKNRKDKKRKHTKIQSSNYDNSFNSRSYDIYKNEKTGLYEPQKPHKGIELKSKKED